MSEQSLAQLRDSILERHVPSPSHPLGGETQCLECWQPWRNVGCPPYRLATALSVENVAAGLADDGGDPPPLWDILGPAGKAQFIKRAAALLGAIPVGAQEASDG